MTITAHDGLSMTMEILSNYGIKLSITKIMKKTRTILTLMVLVALSGCSEKKQAAQEQTVRVKVQQIQSEAVNGEQGFSGTIEESSGTSLSFAVSGTIKRIYVSAGQTVGAGQLIAELDPTTLQHAYTIAKTSLEQIQDTYDRMKELHDAGSLPDMQWIQIESELKSAKASEAMAKKSLADTKDYYRVGSTKMSDLLLAQQQYQQARDRYTDAYADFQTKQLEYRQATGQK